MSALVFEVIFSRKDSGRIAKWFGSTSAKTGMAFQTSGAEGGTESLHLRSGWSFPFRSFCWNDPRFSGSSAGQPGEARTGGGFGEAGRRLCRDREEMKSEFRMSKSETISKFECLNVRKNPTPEFACFDHSYFGFVSCFEIRISNFPR